MKNVKKRLIYPFIVMMLCCFGAQPVFAEKAEESKTEESSATPAFFKQETVEVPIIMYHLVTKNSRYIGKHGITPEELESDLKYLKEKGYQTVVMEDLIAFVNNGIKLPDKSIVLTFDDGNSSDYRYLYPLLQKYDMKAVVSVLGRPTDECTVLASNHESTKIFPTLTWNQIKEMNDSKYVEIQNHSYDLHKDEGSGQKHGESVENYQKRLREDLTKMQMRIKEVLGFEPNTFTYPFGIVSDNAKPVLKELGLIATLSCHDGMNYLKENDLDCLYRLKRDNRPSGVPVSELLEKMNRPQS
ncbi:MAG: polysaccharide deacetylase family protein [Defluviitaleaceae bacterium]|nr:polysaccharide deacetylase family protein [Defluviitaleaceae bacterium]